MLFLSLQERTNKESWNKPVCPNNPVLLCLKMVTQLRFSL